MKPYRDVEKQYEWSQKGKKYKTKYFAALGDLFGDTKKTITDQQNLTQVKRSNESGTCNKV